MAKLSAQEQYEQQQLAESEKMADEIQQELDNSQLSGKVDVDFNAEYVKTESEWFHFVCIR